MKVVKTHQIETASRSTDQVDNFEALYRDYMGVVYQKCLRFTQDAETAKDYTHDIFIKLFDKFERFQHRSSPATWLHAITRNYCLDQLQISRKYTFKPLTGEEEPFLEDTELHDQLQRFEQVCSTLPAFDQQLLRMQYEQGMDQRTIAEQMKLKLSALKMRQLRSKKKLLICYEQIFRNE